MKTCGFKKQEGTVLIMTVIIMSILLISSLSLMRSSESTTIVAGNIAMKEIASNMADIGITEAETTLRNLGKNKETTLPNRYYATRLPTDSNGLPAVNWGNVPATPIQGYNLQYVVERMCTGTLPVSDFTTQCNIGNAVTSGSNKMNAKFYSSDSMYYRVTVRVSGPKNTLSFIQGIITQ